MRNARYSSTLVEKYQIVDTSYIYINIYIYLFIHMHIHNYEHLIGLDPHICTHIPSPRFAHVLFICCSALPSQLKCISCGGRGTFNVKTFQLVGLWAVFWEKNDVSPFYLRFETTLWIAKRLKSRPKFSACSCISFERYLACMPFSQPKKSQCLSAPAAN